jgi:hypothetical protein
MKRKKEMKEKIVYFASDLATDWDCPHEHATAEEAFDCAEENGATQPIVSGMATEDSPAFLSGAYFSPKYRNEMEEKYATACGRERERH